VSLTDYMTLLIGTYKIASAKMWLAGAMENPVYGAWTQLSSGAEAMVDAATSAGKTAAEAVMEWGKKAVTQAWESIAGSAGDVAVKEITKEGGSQLVEAGTTEAAKGVIGPTIQMLTDKMANWVLEKFGPAAYNMLFTSGVGTTMTTETVKEGVKTVVKETIMEDGSKQVVTDVTVDAAAEEGVKNTVANSSFGGLVGATLTVVMWAYLAYQIANILVMLVWACEPQEFELAMKRELKSCENLGSYCATKALDKCIEKRDVYCCYSSPLSRIIMSQARDQLGLNDAAIVSAMKNSGGAECPGIPLNRMAEIDWNAIDLTEWLAILTTTGLLAEVTSPELNIEGLTGSGNEFDTSDVGGEPRANVIERTLERLNGTSISGSREEIRQQAFGPQ